MHEQKPSNTSVFISTLNCVWDEWHRRQRGDYAQAHAAKKKKIHPWMYLALVTNQIRGTECMNCCTFGFILKERNHFETCDFKLDWFLKLNYLHFKYYKTFHMNKIVCAFLFFIFNILKLTCVNFFFFLDLNKRNYKENQFLVLPPGTRFITGTVSRGTYFDVGPMGSQAHTALGVSEKP